nr:membrane protein tms1 [Quercus suber]
MAISVLSIHPMIQASNPRAGLAQAAIVSIYCTYLTFSAVAMEPDDQQCNPLVRVTGTRTASTVIGAIVTFVMCAYTTTRAATYGLAMGAGKPAGYGPIALEDDDGAHTLVSTQPSSRRELRAEALRRAVESGALPASALDDDSDDEDDAPTGKHAGDDEKNGTQYNYALFHIIFMLATAWVATLLTQNVGGDHNKQESDFIAVGRTYWASWVKIVSAWVCYCIFGWTLGAPVLASALDDDSDDEDDAPTGKHAGDDEKNGTQYNYALFHIIFMLATAWVATLLTQNVGGDHNKQESDFIAVGRTYWASWVKIVSAWVCYCIFGWTLGAPVLMPDRFDFN